MLTFSSFPYIDVYVYICSKIICNFAKRNFGAKHQVRGTGHIIKVCGNIRE